MRRLESGSNQYETFKLLEEKKAFIAFSHQPYWRQVWVIQELLLGKKVRFLCGHKEFSWDDMRCLLDNVQTHSETEPGQAYGHYVEKSWESPDNDFHYFPSRIFSMKYLSNTSRIAELFIVIGTFSAFECADPRDRVYGLQSLVESKQRVAVDYTKSIEEVFDDVMWKVMEDKEYTPEHWNHFKRMPQLRWKLIELESPAGEPAIMQKAIWKSLGSNWNLRVRRRALYYRSVNDFSPNLCFSNFSSDILLKPSIYDSFESYFAFHVVALQAWFLSRPCTPLHKLMTQNLYICWKKKELDLKFDLKIRAFRIWNSIWQTALTCSQRMRSSILLQVHHPEPLRLFRKCLNGIPLSHDPCVTITGHTDYDVLNFPHKRKIKSK